jgi:hypothetical protein
MTNNSVVTTIGGKDVLFSQTAQGAGYIYNDGVFSIPQKTGSLFSNVLDVLKSGVEIWKTVETIKNPSAVISGQAVKQPAVISVPNKNATTQQATGNVQTDAQQPLNVTLNTAKEMATSNNSNNTILLIIIAVVVIALIALKR